MTPAEFRQQLLATFDEGELRTLCFDLGVDYESLPGSSKSDKGRELISYFLRRRDLAPLLAACRRERPHLDWTVNTVPTGTAPPDAPTAGPTTPAPSPDRASDPTTIMRGVKEALASAQAMPGAVPLRSLEAITSDFPRLLRALVEGRLVPFLGMDVNRCGRPAGQKWQPGPHPPSVEELAEELARSYTYLGQGPRRLADVSQYVSVVEGAGALRSELRHLLAADYTSTPLHLFFAGLPALLRSRGYRVPYWLIVSTSPDDLLERAFDTAREPYDRVAYVAEGPWRGKFLHRAPDGATHVVERPNEYRELLAGPRTVILKLYGALDRAAPEWEDTFVVTEDHYIDYVVGTELAALLPVPLADRLRNSHLLFLGYRLQDWNQRVILHRLWGEQPFRFASWAVQPAAARFDLMSWSARKVVVLDVSLEDFLHHLSGQVLDLPAAGSPP